MYNQYIRKYDIDVDYFETIDTPEKAYILGFLATDGYNSNTYVSASIQNKDVEVLEFVRNQICKETIISSKRWTPNVSVLHFSSVKLCRDLSKLGIIKNKSKVIRFPNIEDKLLSHFIRGCFDGDGSIMYREYKDGRKKKGIIMNYACASIDFINKLEQILKDKCNLSDRKIHVHKKSGCFYLQYNGSANVKKIYEFLYKNDCFSLKRKKDKFIKYYEANGYLPK